MSNIYKLESQHKAQAKPQREVGFAVFRSHTETYDKSKSPHYPRREERGLDGLVELVKTAPQWRKKLEAEFTSAFVNPKNGPAISVGRGPDGVEGCDLLTIDIDGAEARLSPEDRDEFLASLPDVPIVWYESWHSRVESCSQWCCTKNSKKLRDRHGGFISLKLLLPLSRTVDADDFKRLHWNFVVSWKRILTVDKAGASPQQLQYLLRDLNPDAEEFDGDRWGVLNEKKPFLNPDEHLTEEADQKWIAKVASGEKIGRATIPEYVADDGMCNPAVPMPDEGQRTFFAQDAEEWPTVQWMERMLGRLHPDYSGQDWVKIGGAIHHTAHHAPGWTLKMGKDIFRRWSMFELMREEDRPDPKKHGMGKWNERHFERLWEWYDVEKEGGATWKTVGCWADETNDRTRPDRYPDEGGRGRHAIVEPEHFQTTSDAAYAIALAWELRADNGELKFDLGRYWTWNDAKGVWQELTQTNLTTQMMAWDGEVPLDANGDRREKAKPLKVEAIKCKNVYEQMLRAVVLDGELVEEDVFATAPNGIVDGNGTFWTLKTEAGQFWSNDAEEETVEIVAERAQREHYQTFAIDDAIDPHNPPPTPLFDEFLLGPTGVFTPLAEPPEDWDEDEFGPWPEGQPEQAARFYLEFLGALLLGLACDFAVAAFLYGGGHNGKSTAIDILKECVPEEQRSCIQPQDFANPNYVARLVGSRLNLVDDMTGKRMKDSGLWKSAVDGRSIEAEPKFMQPFEFQPKAAHIVSTNEQLQIRDTTDGFWRRVIVVPFRQQISVDNKIDDLDTLIIEQERGGIISKALAAVCEAINEQGTQYTSPLAFEREKNRWRLENNSVEAFVDELLEFAGEGEKWIQSSDLYQGYRNFCKFYNFGQCGLSKFGKRLKKVEGVEWKQSNGIRYNLRVKPGTPAHIYGMGDII